jgi:tetratricopeptide (TPR) repeat protein
LAKFSLGDNHGAIIDYDRGIAFNPDDVLAYNNRGLAKFYLGDNYGAIDDYDRVIALNPDHAKAYYNRSNVEFQLGDRSAAIADLTTAAELFNHQGQISLADWLMRLLQRYLETEVSASAAKSAYAD